ncbi:MAG: hypothetical protein IPN67_18150 [Bacteroidales bacterium]|nr:hypothetical protein [Bacteroidales bacterium]
MSLKITDWAVEDRPREKLIQYGTSTLSDAELLGILISSGTKEKSAIDLGRELLASVNNNLTALSKLLQSRICQNPRQVTHGLC